MTKFFVILIIICVFTTSVIAAPLLSPTPLCSVFKNQSERTVFIAVRTNYFEGADGTKQRHEASIRLEPQEKQQICAQGPFYDGYRVEVILRTLIPLFDCKTKLGNDLNITQTKEGDVVKLSLNCS
jgi:hypothetical protein